MGITLSCPFATIDDLDSQFESFLANSISFGSHDIKTAHQSGTQPQPSSLLLASGKVITVESSLSFRNTELETVAPVLIKHAQLPPHDNNHQTLLQEEEEESGVHRHLAAVKLQKTYKSFRTRRRLADCAVLVEQRWWKLLDLAELKRSSVSFFDIEKPETAVSRWSRARTRAAKVGKGLSKDDKARKLALQHWLEAIDPRHRYGHNLQFYYVKWLHCESKQPFFYWLDIGEGKEVNIEKCTRSKLQQQCIKYLGPIEREEFEVIIDNGKLMYKQSGRLLDTRGGAEDDKWIFVLSVSKILYVGQKKKGTFQHSSFLAGGATLSAGRLEVEDGILKAVWPHSGHYLPTEENFEEFMSFLERQNVDLGVVQKAPTGDGEATFVRRESTFIRNSLSVQDLSESNSEGSKDTESSHPPSSRWSRRLQAKIALIQIPKRENMLALLKNEVGAGSSWSTQSVQSPEEDNGYETAEEYLSDTEFSVSKENLFDEDEEEEYKEPAVPKEKIMKRINSHKGMKSYQLAKQLSCKWTTGAGPRIGCVRDYPSELQCRVLEEVNLSPRSAFSPPSPKATSTITTTNYLCREAAVGRSPLAP